jgi:hypothetical protein
MKDLREYAKQTNLRLVVGAFILLFVVGVGLIYLIYGSAAAGMGLVCLLAALLPICLIAASLYLMDWISKRGRPD